MSQQLVSSRLGPFKRCSLLGLLVLAGFLTDLSSAMELSEHCTVSVLNRSTPVSEDGVWVLPGVPAGIGKVRLRATCIENGVVTSGSSEPIEIPANGIIEVSEIDFSGPAAPPARLVLSVGLTDLKGAGTSVQILVEGHYPDGTILDLSDVAEGTTYSSTNAQILSVSPSGQATAVSSGSAIVVAQNDSVTGFLRFSVTTSADTDGDGLPDDWELENGLDPNDPGDALLDPDSDGLTTLEEYQAGLNPFDADTDDDGLADGEEVAVHGTEPLLFDTDGDGLSDGLEIQTGSDPLDPTSFNLAAALSSLEVSPDAFTIFFNTALGEASRQLTVTGHLVDGNQLDITSSFYGTVYSSSDLTIANFGADPGRVFAGADGTAVVTAENSGFSAQATVDVVSFSPTALSYLPLSGQPRAVALSDSTVYAAMDRGGLKVVDVSDPESPVLLSTFFPKASGAGGSSPARDVAVSGGRVYLAALEAGLVIAEPAGPADLTQLGAFNPPGFSARSVAVAGNSAYLGGADALAVLDVSDPALPALLGTVALPAAAQDVAVSGSTVLVAVGAAGVRVVDVSDPSQPQVVGGTHLRPNERSRASGLAVVEPRVVVSDGGAPRGLGGLRVVDWSTAESPIVTGSTSNQFGLVKVAADDFGLALAADYFFRNAVPIFHLGNGEPLFREVLDFSGAPSFRDDDGVDIAVSGGLVFLLAEHWYYGDGGLHIGRYLQPNDFAGVPPAVAVVSPDGSAPVKERRRIRIAAEAEDDIYVRSVEIFADGASLGEDFLAPYEAELVVPAGQPSVELYAVARDAAGNTGSSPVVSLPIDPDPAPAVVIRSPLPGQSVPERTRIPVVIEAADDSAVAQVELYVDGVLEETLTEPPYQTTYFVPDTAAARELTARAVDDFANETISAPVPINVLLDLPPEVIVVEPTEGTEVVEGTQLRLVAAAADDVGVERVAFYVNGSLEGVASSGPPWEEVVLVPAAGSPFSVHALAEDTDGQETTSASVAVTVVPDPLTTVTGFVADPEGSAFFGAEVEVETEAETVVAGLSGLDGSFQVSDIPTNEGALTVTAAATIDGESFVAGLPEPSAPSPGGVVDVGILGLRPEIPTTTLVGTIVDADSNPVAGALVRVHNRYVKKESVSLADGSFRIEQVPTATKPASGGSGFTLLYASAFAEVGGEPQRAKASGPLFGVIDGTTDTGTLMLEPAPGGDPGTTAAGFVEDDTGEALADAEVAVSTDYDLLLTTSDAQGDFSLPGVPSLDGNLFVTAEALRFGERVTAAGAGSEPPVAGGTTDLGEIVFPSDDGGGCGDGGCG